MSNNITPINEPHPVMLAMATGRISPQMVEGLLELFDKDPNGLLKVMRSTPADAVIQTHEVKEAKAVEISRFARQRGVGFAEAYVEIHKLANQVLCEPIYVTGPEAA